MQLKQLGSNKTELKINENTRVFFSYETPVAARILTEKGMVYYRTKEYYSRTTSKHINSYVTSDAEECEQSFLDNLVQS